VAVQDGGHVYIDPAVHRALLGVTLEDGTRVIRPRDFEFAPGEVGPC
jgi:hypothetical protein